MASAWLGLGFALLFAVVGTVLLDVLLDPAKMLQLACTALERLTSP
jgi:hypothetical protein